ncbi:hypothetical protein F4802DRAFT_83435 [Xylaria palmicola]|nr:hypothetical protein F4802DRAFT_83435 [Xylaria palmicola]
MFHATDDSASGLPLESLGEHRDRPTMAGDLSPDTRQQNKKQRPGAVWDDLFRGNRSRLTRAAARQAASLRAAARQAEADGGKSKRLGNTTLEQTMPAPPQRLYPLGFKDIVNSAHPGLRPISVHASVSKWLESVGSDQKKHRHSDSYLHCSGNVPISKNLARSVPETPYIDETAVPPTPPSHSIAMTPAANLPDNLTGFYPGKSHKSSLVDDPSYRKKNLAQNSIFLRRRDETFPEDIANLLREIEKDSNLPEASPLDEVKRKRFLHHLEDEPALENSVEMYFRAYIFPTPFPDDDLQLRAREHMAWPNVPTTNPEIRISRPVPDLLYGYNDVTAFPQQQAQVEALREEQAATKSFLMYPFLVVEFKGSEGSLTVATNQCIGGSATSVNIAERLNERLKWFVGEDTQTISNAVFGITMHGTEARLFVSWKHNDPTEPRYYMQKINSFALQEPQAYTEFHKCVQNIIDWGMGERLTEIRNALDRLQEADRQRVSKEAKSRPPPSDGPRAGDGKKRRIS